MHDVTPSLTIHYKTPVDIPSESEWRKQGFTFLPEPIAIAGFDDVDVVINGAATRFGCGFVSVGEKDEKDCVRVNTHFQIEGFPTVFCIGDAAASKYKLAFLAKWQVCLFLLYMQRAERMEWTDWNGRVLYGNCRKKL